MQFGVLLTSTRKPKTSEQASLHMVVISKVLLTHSPLQSSRPVSLGVAGLLSWTTCPLTRRRRRHEATLHEPGLEQFSCQDRQDTIHAHTHTKTATFQHPTGIGRVSFQPACSPHLDPLDTRAWNAIKRDVHSSQPSFAQGGGGAGWSCSAFLTAP